MSQRRARIVVAEGASARKGLLRFVLEGEGYEVVGEASTTAELASQLKDRRPDVVVMDDGIGVVAVGMVHELAPTAKVILIWPEAVVPIGGDARVEPSAVLRKLGPTVEQLTGVPSTTGTLEARRGTGAAAAGALGLGAILALGRAAGSGAGPAGEITPSTPNEARRADHRRLRRGAGPDPPDRGGAGGRRGRRGRVWRDRSPWRNSRPRPRQTLQGRRWPARPSRRSARLLRLLRRESPRQPRQRLPRPGRRPRRRRPARREGCSDASARSPWAGPRWRPRSSWPSH